MAQNTGIRFLTGAPVTIGNPLDPPVRAGSWGPGPEPPAQVDLHRNPADSQLGRIAKHAQHALGGAVITNADGSVRYGQSSRILSADQLHLIYQRTPDVRAAVDQIARVVATHDWVVTPINMNPGDDGYEDALEVSMAATEFLKVPNANGYTWQEVLAMVVTDLLKFDAGPVELCRRPDGTLDELVPVRGGEIIEVLDEKGRLQYYAQTPTGSVTEPATTTKIPADDMLLLQLFRTTEGPGGIPLLESLVHDVIAMLRSSEYIASNLDLNEIPPGLVVITGLANEALQRFRDSMEGKRNEDWRLRVIGSQRSLGPVDAKWVRFQRDPRELQLVDLAKHIQRNIWRVFGVLPVTMGATEGLPRASAEVQIDATRSHLIQPILELLQGKFNARVIPLIVPPEYVGRVGFSFHQERDLSEEEKEFRAQRLGRMVSRGIITRNEARQELGYDPVDNGDILTVEVGQDRIAVVNKLLDDDPTTGNAPSIADQNAASRRIRRLAALHAHEHGPHCGCHAHRERGNLPSEWQPGNKFEGYRTLDLVALGDEIEGYAADVQPLWDQAATTVVSVFASLYKEEGFGPDDRQAILNQAGTVLDKLLMDWAITTAPRYDAVALTARSQVGKWVASLGPEQEALAQAAGYRERAIGFLVQPEGPVGRVRDELMELLQQVGDRRSRDHRMHYRRPPLPVNASVDAVVERATQIFQAQRHRIHNWSGRLLEMAHLIVERELATDVVIELVPEEEQLGKGRARISGP